MLLFFCGLQGNLFQFREFTGWYGSKVLYFGDHVYSDLAVGSQQKPHTKAKLFSLV